MGIGLGMSSPTTHPVLLHYIVDVDAENMTKDQRRYGQNRPIEKLLLWIFLVNVGLV
jgi:hypothetical protein